MSAIKITIEISSLDQANALAAALENYIDCNEDMIKETDEEHAEAKAAGDVVSYREILEHRERKRHLACVRDLLKAIGVK